MEEVRLKIGWTTGVLMLGVLAMAGQADERDQLTIQSDADIEKALGQLSNWGKWGPDDELGTLNYITPRSVREASRLIKSGETVTLAREVLIAGTPGIREPSYRMSRDEMACRDFIGSTWHGFAQTHLDALCHIFADTLKLYNGFSKKNISTTGAKRLGIENMAQRGIVGRGVLLDIAKTKGFILPPGTPVYIEDLEKALARQKVEIRSGDILFIRTGTGMKNTREKRSGLHPECLSWIKEKQIALLGADGDNDVYPLQNFERWSSSFHSVGIPYLGLPLIDNCELETLSAACEKYGQWEFFVTIGPWKLQGATSSPVNPIVVF